MFSGIGRPGIKNGMNVRARFMTIEIHRLERGNCLRDINSARTHCDDDFRGFGQSSHFLVVKERLSITACPTNCSQSHWYLMKKTAIIPMGRHYKQSIISPENIACFCKI